MRSVDGWRGKDRQVVNQCVIGPHGAFQSIERQPGRDDAKARQLGIDLKVVLGCGDKLVRPVLETGDLRKRVFEVGLTSEGSTRRRIGEDVRVKVVTHPEQVIVRVYLFALEVSGVISFAARDFSGGDVVRDPLPEFIRSVQLPELLHNWNASIGVAICQSIERVHDTTVPEIASPLQVIRKRSYGYDDPDV